VLLVHRRCPCRWLRVSRAPSIDRCRIHRRPPSPRWFRRSRVRTRFGSMVVGHGAGGGSSGSAVGGLFHRTARAWPIGAFGMSRTGLCNLRKKPGTTLSCSPSPRQRRCCRRSLRRTRSRPSRNTGFDWRGLPRQLARAHVRFGCAKAPLVRGNASIDREVFGQAHRALGGQWEQLLGILQAREAIRSRVAEASVCSPASPNVREIPQLRFAPCRSFVRSLSVRSVCSWSILDGFATCGRVCTHP